jgi:hypothetical protein
MARARPGAWLTALAALCAVATALALSNRPRHGPVPIAFDREACHHCHMQIGEPAFASQVQLGDGQVLDFDDPGCLLAWLGHQRAPVDALWFHRLRGEGWLSANEVRFARVPQTPMGWGFGAVDASEPGAITLEQAQEEVLRREASKTEAGRAR